MLRRDSPTSSKRAQPPTEHSWAASSTWTAISEQTRFHIAWEKIVLRSPMSAVTMRRDASFLLFILFQFLHFSSPSVFLLYKMGAILLKQKLIKRQDFLLTLLLLILFLPFPSHPLFKSLSHEWSSDLFSNKKPQYIFNYKGKLRLLTSWGKVVDPGTKYFLEKKKKGHGKTNGREDQTTSFYFFFSSKKAIYRTEDFILM